MKALCVLPLLLTGCASFNEGYQRGQMERQQRYVDQLTQACEAYGFKPEAIPECRMKLDAISRGQTPTATQSFARGLRAGAGALSPSVYAADNPGYTPRQSYSTNAPQRSAPKDCTVTEVFGQYNVRCW
jgi:hypothetical protein